MRRSAVRVLAALTLLSAAGCSGSSDEKVPTVAAVQPFVAEKTVRPKADASPTPEQAAIAAVLEVNKTEFNARFEGLAAEATPADVKKLFAGYVEAVEKQETAGCPIAFRAAWTRHLKDWKTLTTSIGRLPNAYEGVEFLDMVQALFQGSSEKGKPLGADVVNGVKAVLKSLADVHTAAERAGMETVK